MVWFNVIKTFLIGKINIIKYIGIVLGIIGLLYLGYDYSETKNKNILLVEKLKNKNKEIETINKNHLEELEQVSNIVREQERQRLELKNHIVKLKKVKRNTNVKKNENTINRKLIFISR